SVASVFSFFPSIRRLRIFVNGAFVKQFKAESQCETRSRSEVDAAFSYVRLSLTNPSDQFMLSAAPADRSPLRKSENACHHNYLASRVRGRRFHYLFVATRSVRRKQGS